MTDEEINKVARKVIDLLADSKYKDVSDVVIHALNTKFSEDLRLTMLSAIEDVVKMNLYSLVTRTIQDSITNMSYDCDFKSMIDDVVYDLRNSYGSRVNSIFDELARRDDVYNLYRKLTNIESRLDNTSNKP